MLCVARSGDLTCGFWLPCGCPAPHLHLLSISCSAPLLRRGSLRVISCQFAPALANYRLTGGPGCADYCVQHTKKTQQRNICNSKHIYKTNNANNSKIQLAKASHFAWLTGGCRLPVLVLHHTNLVQMQVMGGECFASRDVVSKVQDKMWAYGWKGTGNVFGASTSFSKSTRDDCNRFIWYDMMMSYWNNKSRGSRPL